MKAFDFLRDTPPDAIEAVLEWRLPRRYYSAAAAVATVAVAIIAAAGIEFARIEDAERMETRAGDAFEAASSKLAAARLSYAEVQRLRAMDRALTTLRYSGVELVARVAGIGNVVPRGVWLESIAPAEAGATEVRGTATTLDAIDVVLADLSKSSLGRPRLVQVQRSVRGGLRPLVTFELRLQEAR